MEDLESKILDNLSDIELFKQLSEHLNDESQTKRLKTAESLCKVLEEYKNAGVFNLNNSVTDFLWKVFSQISECAVQGIKSTEEKFQAAWCLILLKTIKFHSDTKEIHENVYFTRCVSYLISSRSCKVLSFLIREYQDIGLAIIKVLCNIIPKSPITIDSIVAMLKSLPAPEKIKPVSFIKSYTQDLPRKRKRIDNFDPDISKGKVAVDTDTWEYVYKDAVGKLWIVILSESIPEKNIKVYLKFIPKIGFLQVSEPILFSDFFLRGYELGGSIAVLSLNGLFILCTKYNLESKLYYKKLYQLVKHRLAEGKVLKPAFLKLVDLSLSSHLLPSALVGSFVRLFIKESLRSSASQVIWNLSFGLKCLKVHPALSKMIHNENTLDVFNYNEEDPMLTNASESSLWELQVLQKHYHQQIVNLVKDYEKPLEKIPRISPNEAELILYEKLPQIQIKDYKSISL
jgi:CBF/Mak21 family